MRNNGTCCRIPHQQSQRPHKIEHTQSRPDPIYTARQAHSRGRTQTHKCARAEAIQGAEDVQARECTAYSCPREGEHSRACGEAANDEKGVVEHICDLAGNDAAKD